MPEKEIKIFQQTIWDFYKKNKRDFPWRNTKNPYYILVSEIMLQQTQANRVVRYYQRWIERFPDFASLAGAKFSEIYPYWQGLGYNRRGLNLQKAAQKALAEYKGKLPKDVLLLEEFPGIGHYTARAVSIFSFNTPVACIETNIRRVFIHHFFKDKNGISDEQILKIAQRVLPAGKTRQWHWALMDYGAYLKTQIPNPNRRHKNYAVQSKFEGSLRQIRGVALRILSGEPTNSKTLVARIKKATDQDVKRIKAVIITLEKEGLIALNKKLYALT